MLPKVQAQRQWMRYIFLAEANTEPSLLKDYLMDFLSRMLKLDAYAIDPEILDVVLAEMEVFVDVDKEKIRSELKEEYYKWKLL